MTDDFAIYGHDLFGNPIEPPSRGKIADEFLVPPFSVLNARDGWWQDRKRAWIALGIKGELGRGDNSLSLSLSAMRTVPATDERLPKPPCGYGRAFREDLMKRERDYGKANRKS